MGRTGSESSRRLPRHLRYEDIPTHTFTPRTYQVELLDAAVQQNTLVCLDATSSRMFLSVMLLKEHGHQLQLPLDQGGKRGVFLVNSENDIAKYALMIEHQTDLTVGQYSTDCQDRDNDWWTLEVHRTQVLVMLPSFFHHVIEENLLKLSQVNVLIFDHCQHVLDPGHPYDLITKKLQLQSDAEESPRILGLTSCFTSKHCQDPIELVTTIKKLEKRFSASAETSTLVYSERYGMQPTELVFECDKYEDTTGMVEELGSMLENTLHFLQECNIKLDGKGGGDPIETPKTVIVECLNILYRLGPWCAVSLAQMFVSQLEKIDKHETVDVKKKFLRLAATQLRLLIHHFDSNFSPEYDVEELLLYTTPKVKKLIDHLRRFKPDCDFKIISTEDTDEMDDDSYMSDDSLALTDSSDDEDRSGGSKIIHVAVKKDIPEDKSGIELFSGSDDKYMCGIVFVDHRYVAFALNKFIEEVCAWDDQLCFIKSHHITGQGSKKEGSKSYKKQEDILRKFRLQELNLLLATDVLEEGVDIPKCNLIIKFDPPKDYRSYSQSKGRARARESEYVILADKSNLKAFRTGLAKYKDIEGVLKGIWKRHDDEDQINCDNITDLYHDILPPYKPCDEEGGVQVTLTSAIGLVNRYCAKLPSDAFTHLTPKCVIGAIQKGEQTVYSATLRLPINSPLKEEIQGIPMPTRMLAKQAVALKACEILHKSGEIDDQLLPIGKELFMKEEEDSSTLDSEDIAGEARPGTTKRKQYYIKQLGSSLVKGHPTVDTNFLFLIQLTLTQPISDDQNTRGRRVYTPEETNRGFGLLSSKHIPMIPTFPLYTRSGEVTVSLDLLRSGTSFTEEELARLQEFHRFVFTEVLRLEKDPMEFQPDQADLGYCIIPLNRKTDNSDYFVDWDFIDLVKLSKQAVKRNIYDSKREIFEFKKDEYEDAVVMPSYRNIDQPQHFYVAEIRSDLNPSSAFPSPELYKTFSEYYTTKYGLTVTNQEQPLLDVDHTSARLNLLTPRYMNQKGVALPTSSAETKKARRENLQQKQILVPELCEVHVFPSSLWRKAVCLPTILYRINYLLVAEEIRIRIATSANIGQVDLPPGFVFPALDFGFSVQEEKEHVDRTEEKMSSQEGQKENENTKSADKQVITVDENVQTEELEKTKVLEKENQDTGIMESAKVYSEERDVENMNMEGNGENLKSGNYTTSRINVKSDRDTTVVASENVKSDRNTTVVASENVKSDRDTTVVASENVKSDRNTTVVASENVKSDRDTTVVASENVKSDRDTTVAACENVKSDRDTTVAASENVKSDRDITVAASKNVKSDRDTTVAACKNVKSDPDTTVVASENLKSDRDTTVATCENLKSDRDTTVVACENVKSDRDTTVVACENVKSDRDTPVAACENLKSDRDTTVAACENVKSDRDTTVAACENVKSERDTIVVACENVKSDRDTTVAACENVKLQESVTESEVVKSDIDYENGQNSKKTDTGEEQVTPEKAPSVDKEQRTELFSQNTVVNKEKSGGSHTSQVSPVVCEGEDQRTLLCNGHYAEETDKQCKLNKDICDIECKYCVQRDLSTLNNHDCGHTQLAQCIKSCKIKNTPHCNGLSTNGLLKDFSKLTTNCSNQFDTRDDESCSDILHCDSNRHKVDQAESCDIQYDCDNTREEGHTGWGDPCDDQLTPQTSQCQVSDNPTSDENQWGEQQICENENQADVFSSVGHFGKSDKCDVKKSAPVDLSKVAFPDPLLSLDVDIDLSKYIGPSPCTILQALTMSNANDFFSLERLETIGDSFLKYAITVYLYCTYPGIHEGKLSYLRSKQVSNCNLYRLGKKTGLAECMISTKFEPYENWLPPGYVINETKRKGPVPHVVLSKTSDLAKEAHERITEKLGTRKLQEYGKTFTEDEIDQQIIDIDQWQEVEEQDMEVNEVKGSDVFSYCLQTLHSIPDKSIADCVESLIGCYLTSCGKKAALRFMFSLGLKVLPPRAATVGDKPDEETSTSSQEEHQIVSSYGYQCPPSPLLSNTNDNRRLMEHLLIGYESFEEKIGYKFRDRAYLLQAFTHASYHYNNITDCYQRLEFLGDAILDYVITRHLYEDSCKYSPGVLTDLRSALVNNNIFAALAVKWDFHKYFKAISPPLFQVIEKFVAKQKERDDEIDLEDEDENEDASEEYVELEVPKALGDIFESLAGAIYLDSGLSLDVVWRVYYRMMKPQIDKYLKSIPKSPVRELLEMEPETAKFEKPERTLEGKIRVTVNVVSKGVFVGIGRNYRIAKSAAAKKALRCMKAMQSQGLI
ncbi:endoribonuclease Dicer-like [Mizuhopecten yessoensis]|uniref:ribonuclease III n=1 Tax=Mizuhopecten yessoensis TaxID=6573 RepID=A0A210QXA0_MIZYE|nr:endoribonuclease Dicer-like [Mizuhopecten yessoensis]OWF53355.1 Endoribonuclease Dicer [Mizuhopecten yessoensis]